MQTSSTNGDIKTLFDLWLVPVARALLQTYFFVDHFDFSVALFVT